MSIEQPMNVQPAPSMPAALAATQSAELGQIILRQQEELATLRAASEKTTVDNALAAAIVNSGANLQPGGAEQLRALLRNELSIINHNGTPTVAGPGLKPVGDFVKETLARPEFAHFQKANNPHGGTQRNPAAVYPVDPATMYQPVPEPSRPDQAPPRTLGEGMLRFVRDQKAEMAASGLSDPTTNLGLAFGLKVPTK